MSEIVVRSARETDDFLEIAACIYLTDPFIYPAAFGADVWSAAKAISKLMSIEKGLFHPDNLVLALQGETICGILLYNKDGAVWNRDRCADMVRDVVPDIQNFEYVSKAYFTTEAATPPENHIEVIACCVMPQFRKKGIGKLLLNWMNEKYPTKTRTLDVLSNNIAAIRLYQKSGFEIVEEYRGFSLDENTRPNCYRMIKTC